MKQVFARQRAKQINTTTKGQGHALLDIAVDGTIIDEVVEIIELPELEASDHELIHEIEQDPAVVHQTRSYTHTIATLDSANPFHNFGHVRICRCLPQSSNCASSADCFRLLLHCFIRLRTLQ